MRKIAYLLPILTACGGGQGDQSTRNQDPAPATSAAPGQSDNGTAAATSMKFTNDCLGTAPVDKKYTLTAFDRVDINSEETLLSAKVEQKVLGVMTGVSDVETTFSYDASPEQKMMTDDQGFARLPGARSEFKEAPFCYTVKAGDSVNYGRTFYWPSAQPVLVVFLDETLTSVSAFKFSLKENKDIAPRPGAAQSLTRLSELYRIVYVSILDESSFNQVRSWLRDNKFPIGPIAIWDWGFTNTMGTNYDEQLTYKREYISDLKKRYPNIKAGIGSREEDAVALQDQGIRTLMIENDESDLPAGITVYQTWELLDKAL